MKHTPKPICLECDAPDAKIITLFTRNSYCGRRCLAEGQLKESRELLRRIEEMTDAVVY